jgi:ATP-dependent DNA helicase RecQ
MEIAVLMRRALLLDLEVSHQGNILKLGAVCGDVSLARPRGHSLASALDQLGALGANASLVLGHNLVRFDLPILRQAAPRHPLLGLPVIDTLVLSPICFPENPYHRLVKDYKLVR